MKLLLVQSDLLFQQVQVQNILKHGLKDIVYGMILHISPYGGRLLLFLELNYGSSLLKPPWNVSVLHVDRLLS